MAQFYCYANLDKKEVCKVPGAKTMNKILTNSRIPILEWLIIGSGDDGEYKSSPIWGIYETLARWSGDRVILVGDYDPSNANQIFSFWIGLFRTPILSAKANNIP